MCTCNRVSAKCIKMKKAHAKRAEQLFFTIKYLNLGSFGTTTAMATTSDMIG